MASDVKLNYYQTRLSYSPEREAVWKEIVRYLSKFVDLNSAVLDLGAGYCSFINQVTAVKKSALDKDPEFIKFAHPDVQTIVGESGDLSMIQNASLDVVFSSNLFEHLSDSAISKTLDEVGRALKEGGRLIIIQPNFKYCSKEYFDDYTHVKIFTHESLKDLLLTHGFKIEHVEPRFIPFSMKDSLPKWSWLVFLYLNCPFRPFAGQMLVIANKPSHE
ncbi:MAG: hypothetical protein AUJ11_00070 [Parcubacteria group bacterium CG1_02_44_65]|nr:MAG: hypothetical protein AUJ11_00070 [Parcubacteria group bacterium CG1_02_44_65]